MNTGIKRNGNRLPHYRQWVNISHYIEALYIRVQTGLVALCPDVTCYFKRNTILYISNTGRMIVCMCVWIWILGVPYHLVTCDYLYGRLNISNAYTPHNAMTPLCETQVTMQDYRRFSRYILRITTVYRGVYTQAKVTRIFIRTPPL